MCHICYNKSSLRSYYKTFNVKRKFSELKKYIWFKDPKKIDFKKDKSLIIHYTLALGTLNDLKTLSRIYTQDEIKKTFRIPVKGLYEKKVLNLCKLWLDIDKLEKENSYIKSIR